MQIDEGKDETLVFGATQSSDWKNSCWVKVCGCCCCFLLILVAAIPIFVIPAMTDLAITLFATFNDTQITQFSGDGYNESNIAYKTKWPGCPEWTEGMDITSFDDCIECFDSQVPRRVQAQFLAHPMRRVNYTSRAAEGVETIMLGGWLLPAIPDLAEGNDGVVAPRIVVQHGFRSNANEFGPLVVAFDLRRMGFTVLLNNLRDHGFSGRSKKHLVEWGDSYPFDELGAWDYLVNDPEGILGSPLPMEKVGIMGFSMGAFTTANAFGLDANVPAAWLDSPPWTPKGVLVSGAVRIMAPFGLGWLARIIGEQVWDGVDEYAREKGVILDKHTPEKVLPKGPDTKRPIMVTSHPEDKAVPLSEVESMYEFLPKYPKKYVFQQFAADFDTEKCNGFAHCLSFIVQPELYLPKLCKFWKTAFGQDPTTCPKFSSAEAGPELSRG